MSYSPSKYRNVIVQTSQNNFNRQQMNPPQIQFPPGSFAMNYQGPYPQNSFGRPAQPDPFLTTYQQAPNLSSTDPFLTIPQAHYESTRAGHSTQLPLNEYIPQQIFDQIRTTMGSTTPIFILPNSNPNPPPQQPQPPPQQQQQQQQQQHQPVLGMGYSGLTMGYPVPPSIYCSPSCYPFPFPMSIYDFIANQNQTKNVGCDCCKKMNVSFGSRRTCGTSCYNSEEVEEHRCIPSNDDTICTKRNCPSAINLQALASQLLSIQGIISCVVTRLILRKIPGSNINTTMEETLERGRKSIDSLNKDQLLAEASSAQQVNALINLHMTAANPPPNIIPILTSLQLKVNLLKARVENLVNKKLMECQSFGMSDTNNNMDLAILSLKSDDELRELLSTLRQKECEERVNFNFAPYHSQRVIAESRLNNIQNKISQVEGEMNRRRNADLPRTPIVHAAQQLSNSYCTSGLESAVLPLQNYTSPDPFLVQVSSPKRLNLKPFVGSSKTTYKSPKKVPRSKRVPKDEREICFSKDSPGPDTNSSKHTWLDGSYNSGNTNGETKKNLLITINESGNVNLVKDQVPKEISMEGQITLSPRVVIVIDKTNNSKKEVKPNDEEWKASSESSEFLKDLGSYSSISRNIKNCSSKEKDVEESGRIEEKNKHNNTNNEFTFKADDDASNSIELMRKIEEDALTSTRLENFEMRPDIDHDGSHQEENSRTLRPYNADQTTRDDVPAQNQTNKTPERKNEFTRVDEIEEKLPKTHFRRPSRDFSETWYSVDSTLTESTTEENKSTESALPNKEDDPSCTSLATGSSKSDR